MMKFSGSIISINVKNPSYSGVTKRATRSSREGAGHLSLGNSTKSGPYCPQKACEIQKLLCKGEQAKCGLRMNLILISSLLSMKGSMCCGLQYIFQDRNAFFPKYQQMLYVPFMDSYIPSLLSYPSRHLKYYLVIYFLGHTSKQVYRLRVHLCVCVCVCVCVCAIVVG